MQLYVEKLQLSKQDAGVYSGGIVFSLDITRKSAQRLISAAA